MSRGPISMLLIERLSVSGLAAAGGAAARAEARAVAAAASPRTRRVRVLCKRSSSGRRAARGRPYGAAAADVKRVVAPGGWPPRGSPRTLRAASARGHGPRSMSPPPKLPIVAILVRPHVGKSTLVDRYAGFRRALVEDEPGVTRDTIAHEVEVAPGRSLLLVDTAGLDPDPEEGLPAAVQAQARAAMAQADAILFVVDGSAGLVAVEATLARSLHRSAKPVTLVVNKIDHPNHASRVAEFARLGFASLHAVSAEHGSGAWDALEDLASRLPVPPEQPAGPEAPE